MHKRHELIHDIAVAQASFVLAAIAPSAAMLHDDDDKDAYLTDVILSTRMVMATMRELMMDDENTIKVARMGMKIVEDRAAAAA
ncbi:hypothetical protein [Acidithiobacillus caldus]|uniref:hypothetical protein n=1 Tax=Acidithiobacillus caldus TaxID=33059 RepID=UPI001C069A3A|nr:hypothetical protein [Acidithiobacillus caldus]MBU2771597.1 hypothetical protein [Acidithiobacillus caldus]